MALTRRSGYHLTQARTKLYLAAASTPPARLFTQESVALDLTVVHIAATGSANKEYTVTHLRCSSSAGEFTYRRTRLAELPASGNVLIAAAGQDGRRAVAGIQGFHRRCRQQWRPQFKRN
jgi:hypothetical protein